MAIQRVFPKITLTHARYGKIKGTCIAHVHQSYVVCLSESMIDGEREYRKGWRIICHESETKDVVITPVTQAEQNAFYKRK